MAIYFQSLKVEISSYEDIKRLEWNKNGSFISFLHHKNSTQAKKQCFLDLKFKFTVPEKLEVHINLLLFFKGCCLSIENHAWESNRLKDGTIQLGILNKSFYNDTSIKKNQEIDYIFIMNQKRNEKIVTL